MYVNGERLGEDSGKRDIELMHQNEIKIVNEVIYEVTVLQYHRN
ncbi:hypothetical protein SAMN05216225_101423 [Ornithinibacillus halophilus]|uniref:Uncharacterized protein n=2 Tax=Ornithinibacillus halophilus TaxID=930117 RepID=A0A1M5GRV3_9BACI|nr:hypothetical protein SAMN05216225_101423 [Ornithinibacillus halophilus]